MIAVLGIAVLFLGFAGESFSAGAKTKKESKRVESQMKKLVKKTPAKKMLLKSAMKKKPLQKMKKSAEKQQVEKRMPTEMTKKGPVNIKKDELVKLREQKAIKKDDARLKKGSIKIEKQIPPQEGASSTDATTAGTSTNLLDSAKDSYDGAVKSE